MDLSFELPELDQVLPQVIELTPEARLLLRGRNLAEVNVVEVDGRAAVMRSQTSTSLRIDLPAGLGAGTRQVQVFREVTLGNPPVQGRLKGSSPVSFVLRPRLLAAPEVDRSDRSIAVSVEPPVAPGQRVSLLLVAIAGEDGAAHALGVRDGAVGAGLTFGSDGVEAGAYLVRLQVDGVVTALEVDNDPEGPTFDRYVAPRIELW